MSSKTKYQSLRVIEARTTPIYTKFGDSDVQNSRVKYKDGITMQFERLLVSCGRVIISFLF
jgi:hypothetical protein